MKKGSYCRLAAVFSVLIGTIFIPTRSVAAPIFISQSGQTLGSLFDGLKPTYSGISWQIARNRPASRRWKGILRSRLPGLIPVVIYSGDNCPGWEECSGSYTEILSAFPGECDSGDGEVCDVYDFTNSSDAPCTAGEAQAYCGEFCCVSAFPCTNNNVVCP